MSPRAQLRLGVWRESELVVDLFAGGGGTSEGIKAAIGRDPDIAINHDPLAVAMHEANHPRTKHYCESVFKVVPRDAVAGRPVGLLWLSPDCTHFSKSKGGKPRSKKIRGLAWVAVRWAKEVAPRVIILENVEEFEGWGPLLASDLPDPKRAGKTFRAFKRKLESYGYKVEHRILVAADYGVPTTRKRLFLIARRDGAPISWPAPTHAKDGAGARRWRPAADVIDWSIPCPSIFERSKPLAEPTLRRIAVGIWRYVIDAARPFIVPVTHQGPQRVFSIDDPMRTVTAAHRGELALVTPYVMNNMSNNVPRSVESPLATICSGSHKFLLAPTLVSHYGESTGRSIESPVPTVTAGGGGHQALVVPTMVTIGHGEREGQTPRAPGIEKPLGTVVATAENHGLVAALLSKHYGSPDHRMRAVGSDLHDPASTVTAKDHHALSAVFLDKYYGSARAGVPVTEPVPTVTAGADHIAQVRAFLLRYDRTGVSRAVDDGRIGIVSIGGEDWQIVDIGMRMLQPRELFRAQGFGDHYNIAPVCDRIVRGKAWRGPLPKTEQIAKAGNSVCPPLAEALVRSNWNDRSAVAA